MIVLESLCFRIRSIEYPSLYLLHNLHIKLFSLQIQHGRPNSLHTYTITPHRQPSQPHNLSTTRIPQMIHHILNPLLGCILDTHLFRLSSNVLSLNVGMMSIAWFDYDLDLWVGFGKVEEMG